MSDKADETKIRTTLGLPRGSVRALLTLIIVSVVVTESVRGHAVPIFWTETLMIAMAHYFTSRRFMQLAPEVIQRLEEEGHIEKESNPLFLPRHSIRIIILLTFVALGVYLYKQNQLFNAEALSVLGTVFAYLIGFLVKPILDWYYKGKEKDSLHWWEDTKAAVVLIVLIITAGCYLFNRPELLPVYVRNGSLCLVLFYFGSR